jgi:hypothetical protein
MLRNLAPHNDAGDRQEFERVDDDWQRSDLVAALRRLAARDVALVTMTALDGYRLAEVAQLLGSAARSPETRPLHRALKRGATPGSDPRPWGAQRQFPKVPFGEHVCWDVLPGWIPGLSTAPPGWQ